MLSVEVEPLSVLYRDLSQRAHQNQQFLSTVAFVRCYENALKKQAVAFVA
jgi:hypothetical protein